MPVHPAVEIMSRLSIDMVELGNKYSIGKSQDPLDKILHDIHIKRHAEKVLKKSIEQDLTKLEVGLTKKESDAIVNIIAKTKETKIGSREVIAESENYTYVFSTKAPARSFSKDKLVVVLSKRGWTKELIDALIEECIEEKEPAKSHEIITSGS